MIRLRFIFLIIPYVCLLNSCQQVKQKAANEEVRTLEMPSQRRDASDTFNDFFRFSHLIPLETNDDCLIRFISKIAFYKERIYILDALDKGLLAFNMQGQFVRGYKHLGQGPEEYASLTDFSIQNDTLYLIDCGQGRLVSYTLDDTFISSASIEKTEAVHLFSKDRYASNRGFGLAEQNSNTSQSYAFYDKGKRTVEDVPFNKYLLGHRFTYGFGNNYFYTYTDSVFISFPLNDTIYWVNAQSGELSPYIAIQTGEESIGLEDREAQVKKLSETGTSIFALYKWNSHLLFTYKKGKEWTNVLTHNDNVLFHGRFVWDENYLPVHTVSYDTDKEHNLLLSIIQPSEINFQRYAAESPVIKELSTKITDDSNPILVFYQPVF